MNAIPFAGTGKDWTAQFEGKRNAAYWDPIGKVWTIGRGHIGPDVVQGLTWSDAEIDQEYDHDYNTAEIEAEQVVGQALFATLCPARQAVLTDLAFELGLAGERKFFDFIRYVKCRMFKTAANDLEHTLLAHQVPHRVRCNAEAMRTGVLVVLPS